jgi:excisionase family DNA binding protein
MASPSAERILSSMVIIPTVSTEEAGAALGVVPATIRERIRNGSLSAVKVGRGWRVHSTSLNALLSGSGTPSASSVSRPAVVPEHQQAAASPAQNDGPSATSPSPPTANAPIPTVLNDAPAAPPASSQTVKPAPSDPYDAEDRIWIERYSRDLISSDPQVRADAAWHLGQFAQRAQRIELENRAKAIKRLSAAECQEMAAAILASSPAGSGW